jgi:hypothetical protein
MLKLNKIECDNMLDIRQCLEYSEKIEDAVLEVNNLMSIYDDAYYYIHKNESKDSDSLAEKIKNECNKLSSIRNDLGTISFIIKRRAQEIYDDELAELRRKEEEEKAKNNT